MKAKEFITEGLHEYDEILHNLLKIWAWREKNGKYPFGHQAVNFQGTHLNDKSTENVNSLLARVGAKGRYHSGTVRHPLTQPMADKVQDFIDNNSSGGRHDTGQKTFEKSDIAPLAKIIYNWSKEVQQTGKRPK